MRIRTVKPEFWTNEKMSILPDFTRLLALGLLNYADDRGYFWANPIMLRGALFPFEEDSSKLRRSLAQLESNGYIALGKTADGREVGFVVNFAKHQRVDRPKESEIKPLATFDEHSTNDRRSLDDESSLDRKGREGKGKDRTTVEASPAPDAEKERPRNLLFDALAQACDSDPFQMTASEGRACGVALAAIRKASPAVAPEDFKTRAANYRTHYSNAALTPSALSAHWSVCAKPNGNHASNRSPNSRSFTGQPTYDGVTDK